MSRLATFFHGADTEVGVFYPKYCLVAMFPDGEGAQKTYIRLRNRGYSDEDVIAVSGPEVLEFFGEHAQKHGLWTKLMTEFSRFLDTEATYADHDLKMARQGAAFVVVHCPGEKEKSRVWAQIEELHPLAARYYGEGGVEHLAGEC